jgi:asparagine synthase (glutamine-hydrolysing)
VIWFYNNLQDRGAGERRVRTDSVVRESGFRLEKRFNAALKARDPLDHRIVEFAATLPAELKIRGARQKVILRELMKDKLPPAILNREKIGFNIPAHERLRGPLRELLEDSLQFGLSEYGQLFCRDGIERLKNRHFQREINIGYHLWGLLILFLWMKQWQVKI